MLIEPAAVLSHGISAYPRTFLAAVLSTGPSRSVVWLGVAGNTWVAVSRGTTRRTFVVPEGRTWYRSVEQANMMASRQEEGEWLVFC